MKKIIVILLLVISLYAFGSRPAADNSLTLRQISAQHNVPVSKLLEYLKLERTAERSVPVLELGRSNEELEGALTEYWEKEKSFQVGIVIVGMGTVFLSLALVALIIDQLRHLDRKKKGVKERISAIPQAVYADTEEEDTIAAIAASLYLFELEQEETNKLLLTWKRAPLSMWKAARFIPMHEVDPSRSK